ncbi:MAG: hypothetical protein HY898_04215 [Deltaproteobacteria bacterium]|nr:hypothetical protein [Deltaproteobacteria bacterium]
MRQRFRRAPTLQVASAAALVCAATSGSASAYTFDAKGQLFFDDGAGFTESFENYPSGPGIEVIVGDALEGKSFARLTTDPNSQSSARIVLQTGPKAAAVRIRAFVRGSTSWYPYVLAYYQSGPGPKMTFGSLYPTGRMTSDGWVEIESPPISIDGTRSPYVELGISSDQIDVDAIEIVPDAVGFKPSSPCAASKPSACLAGQFCVQGYCQDGDAMVPPLPPAPKRDLVVDVLERKLWLAFGGVYTRKEAMPLALAEMETMRTASHAWAFWSSMARGVSLLHDSHTSPYGIPQFFSRGGKAFPVCFVEGDGDLSHSIVPADATYADVLVSHVGPDKNLGLKAGDRIVAVDGQHPIAWAEKLLGLDGAGYGATDPTVHSGAVESLPTQIASYAETIDVIRCTAGAGSCSAPETIAVASFADDSQQDVTPVCDHRPAYHLATGNPDPVTHDFEDVHYGLLADSAPGEDLYGMIWNDTGWDYQSANPWKPAFDAFRAKAKGLVLDHRRGDGGTPQGAAYLTELSLQPKTAAAWSIVGMLGIFDEPFTQADGLSLFDLWKNDESRSYVVGSTTPKEDIRIAVLLARDVSGSDFFPFGVKGAANTRLFGRRTMGAFSTFMIYEMPSYFFWSLASGDFLDPTGQAQIGHGVEPDDNVLPAQSDLMVGKDTVYERALAWVRCGKVVCP